MRILILSYSLHIVYSDTETRVIKPNIILWNRWRKGQAFMFEIEIEIEKKWRPASSLFKALLHHAGKGVARRKLQKTTRVYIKERTKQREHLNGEIAGLDKLLKEGSIDEDIYSRLKKLLEIGYEQKRRETREMYGFAKKPDADKAG